MFSNGMNTKGKKCSNLHDQAAERTGLPLQVVKDWVGNKKKVAEGRTKPYEKNKTIYIKGMTAYNCFVREKKEEFSDMKEWAPAWNTLADDEKQAYKEKAKEAMKSCLGSVKDIPRQLKMLNQQLAELAELGVDLAAVGVDSSDGKLLISGTGKSAFFFRTRPNITNELYAHLSLGMGKGACEGDEGANHDKKKLRVKAQNHMNHLYSQACGKEDKFPYKNVRDGKILIRGFPDTLLPIRTVSNYGEDKLRLILSIKEISIENVVEPEPLVSDSLAAPEVPSDLVEDLGELLNVFWSEGPNQEEHTFTTAHPGVSLPKIDDASRKRKATKSVTQVTEKIDVNKKTKHKEGSKQKKWEYVEAEDLVASKAFQPVEGQRQRQKPKTLDI